MKTQVSPNMGRNNEDLSNLNKSFIIKYLRQNGVCSRAQISKAMGLTQASISKITGQMIEENILYEVGFITGEKGRRSVGVMLNTLCKRVLGVRISRRSFGIGVCDLAGHLYDIMVEQFTAETTLHDLIIRIRGILLDYLKRYQDIASIGVAVPGPFDLHSGKLILTTSMATPDWTNTDLREQFGEFPVPITFGHDADSGALANWWFGSEKSGYGSSLVHFLVGDGVGAGYVLNGEVVNPERNFSREVGHISIDVNGSICPCGNRGCLELYCSSFAFLHRVHTGLADHPESSLVRLMNFSPRDVFAAAKAGDAYAIDCVYELSTYIGYGVVNIIAAYVPDLIIISNEMAWAGQPMLNRVREVVNERVSKEIAERVTIQLEDDWIMQDPILFGAAALAVNFCVDRPSILLGAK